MNQFLEEQYKNLGISREVYEFGEKIEESLKERFAEIDARAEYNQMKVIKAMQENRVSAECFNMSSGYGYNDLGRDTLEKVYASCFKGEDALVRPQITCGTHALALTLSANLRPGDELLSIAGKLFCIGINPAARLIVFDCIAQKIDHDTPQLQGASLQGSMLNITSVLAMCNTGFNQLSIHKCSNFIHKLIHIKYIFMNLKHTSFQFAHIEDITD